MLIVISSRDARRRGLECKMQQFVRNPDVVTLFTGHRDPDLNFLFLRFLRELVDVVTLEIK